MSDTESDKIEMDRILYGTGYGLRDSPGEIKHIPLEDIYIMSNPNDQMQKDYNDAINFTLSTDEPKMFLQMWNEGEWDRLEDDFGYVVSNELRNPHLTLVQNTMVTVTYSNGSTREFVASDELENLINEGHMFSVTTMHSDMCRAEEEAVSKMYAGNPIAALGNMMMVHKNAMDLSDNDLDDEVKKVIVDILATCITLLSDEVTSHQSGMTPEEVDVPPNKPSLKLVEKSDGLDPNDCQCGKHLEGGEGDCSECPR